MVSLSIRHQASLRSSAVALSLLTILGCDPNPTCEPPITGERTNVEVASFPELWTRPGADGLSVLLTDAPYALADASLEPVRRVTLQQAGIEVSYQHVGDSGFPGEQTLSSNQLVRMGCVLAANGSGPRVAVITVWDSDDGSFGFIEPCSDQTGTIIIHRARSRDAAIGPITVEQIDALTLLHEFGHSLGVPARAYHTSSIDGEHCTNGNCVMFKGSRVNTCAVLANLSTGLPLRFCDDCAEELQEQQARRARSTVP